MTSFAKKGNVRKRQILQPLPETGISFDSVANNAARAFAVRHCRLEQKAKALAEKAANKASDEAEAGSGKGWSHFGESFTGKKHGKKLESSQANFSHLVNLDCKQERISGFKGHLKF